MKSCSYCRMPFSGLNIINYVFIHINFILYTVIWLYSQSSYFIFNYLQPIFITKFSIIKCVSHISFFFFLHSSLHYQIWVFSLQNLCTQIQRLFQCNIYIIRFICINILDKLFISINKISLII